MAPAETKELTDHERIILLEAKVRLLTRVVEGALVVIAGLGVDRLFGPFGH